MREIRTSGLMSGDGKRGNATAPVLDSTGERAQAAGHGGHGRARPDPRAQPANVQDRDGAPFVLRLSRRSFPFIAKAFADMGFAGERPANATSVTIEIVRKPPDQIGFAVHPRRWV